MSAGPELRKPTPPNAPAGFRCAGTAGWCSLRMTVAAVVFGGAALVAVVGGVEHPFGGRASFAGTRGSTATPTNFDGSFIFCRIRFRNGTSGDGNGWDVDYPRADENLSIRLSELTKTSVSFDEGHEPNHVLVRPTDPDLFNCPFTMLTEPGGAYFSQAEAAALRAYLLKGGFLWADDFWGDYAFSVWAREIGKALPPHEFPIVDLQLDHPIFHTLFQITRVPQIPSIGFWAGSGGRTSERGALSAVPHVRAISDAQGRIMVLMTHNTDFGDSFEEEATDHRYFLQFSVDGYRFGVNALLYAMTH